MLVGFSGFGGAGKTTAIQWLASRGLGSRVYLGEGVLQEIGRRGLERSPANEILVRTDLRACGGASVLADLAAPEIRQVAESRSCALIDAIFNPEERERIQSIVPVGCYFVWVEASLDVRADRLRIRTDRHYTREQICRRDELERKLRIDSVRNLANFTVHNEGTLQRFHESLDELWRKVSASP